MLPHKQVPNQFKPPFPLVSPQFSLIQDPFLESHRHNIRTQNIVFTKIVLFFAVLMTRPKACTFLSSSPAH